ncbi:EAL domain-containing protein [Sulfurimonas aquatica]|uniref:EAL domain-containing protein n=2 Tax=Sulfurimonas aquatica TaxID=2672570 RepID=A0A975GE39_9BACT|nr:EAL domain-containing protein [Sulfurimonas aquatica]
MGLPIFALIIALVSHTLVGNYDTLESSFYVESILLLVFSIYFILFLIYRGYDVKITDDVTKTFTREYLYKHIKKKLKLQGDYTLILVSIDNLNDINRLYGINNGDKVLEEISLWIANYLKSQKIENFPLGHIKGGDFILGLEGLKSEFTTILDLMCLKSSELKVENIEIKISGSIIDTEYSRDLNYLVENLFISQEENRNSKNTQAYEHINPNELELLVIDALKNRSLTIMKQDVFKNKSVAFSECFIKLKAKNSKLLYPKSYLKVINKLGLNIEYDLMILEQVLLFARHSQTPYALSISPTSLRNEKFIAKTKELLEESYQKVIFILSEQEYCSHISRYNSILKSLQKSGVLIAIDRLGAIHTSFLYLRELDVDIVRFDSYYSSKEKLKENENIIDGFNLMAHEKGIKSWIKNIEEDESFELVNKMNIDYKQGKYLSSLQEIYAS